MKEQRFIALILSKGDFAQYRTAHIEDLLQKLVAAGVPFDATMATVDLMIWASRGVIKPFRYYAKRWAWSEQKTRGFFAKHELLAPKKSSEKQDTARTQTGHNTDTKTAVNKTNSHNTDTTRTQEGHNEDTVYHKDNERVLTRTRVRPTLEEILEYCKFMSYPEEVGINAFDHYESVGWINGMGLEISDWKALIRKSHTKYQTAKRMQLGANHGTAITKTTAPSTNSRRQAISDGEFTQRTNAARQLVAAEMARRVAAESTTDT